MPGDRTPDRTQRLLNRGAWDTFAAMSQVRRFVAADLDAAARRNRRRGGMVIGAIDETGQEKGRRGGRSETAVHGVRGLGGKRDHHGPPVVRAARTGHRLIGGRQWIPQEHTEDPVKSLVMGCRTRGAAKVHALRLAWETAAA